MPNGGNSTSFAALKGITAQEIASLYVSGLSFPDVVDTLSAVYSSASLPFLANYVAAMYARYGVSTDLPYTPSAPTPAPYEPPLPTEPGTPFPPDLLSVDPNALGPVPAGNRFRYGVQLDISGQGDLRNIQVLSPVPLTQEQIASEAASVAFEFIVGGYEKFVGDATQSNGNALTGNQIEFVGFLPSQAIF